MSGARSSLKYIFLVGISPLTGFRDDFRILIDGRVVVQDARFVLHSNDEAMKTLMHKSGVHSRVLVLFRGIVQKKKSFPLRAFDVAYDPQDAQDATNMDITILPSVILSNECSLERRCGIHLPLSGCTLGHGQTWRMFDRDNVLSMVNNRGLKDLEVEIELGNWKNEPMSQLVKIERDVVEIARDVVDSHPSLEELRSSSSNINMVHYWCKSTDCFQQLLRVNFRQLGDILLSKNVWV